MAASPRGDTISSQEMSEQSKETQQDGGVCIWPRALPPGGHSMWGQVPVWQTPVLVITGAVHAPAALENPLLIQALHLCPQRIPDPRVLPINTLVCGSLVTCSALSPPGGAECSPPGMLCIPWGATALLCLYSGCLIINNKFLQPCSDVGSHRKACSPSSLPYWT